MVTHTPIRLIPRVATRLHRAAPVRKRTTANPRVHAHPSAILSILILLTSITSAAPEPAGGGFQRAVEQAATRVVRLYGLKAGLSAGYGSGILVSDDGLLVTVTSLLLDSEQLRVVTSDGTVYGADMIGSDRQLQLALMRLRPLPSYDRRGNRIPGAPVEPGRFQYFTPGDSTRLQPGDWIIAAGNPFKVAEGSEAISVTVGVFSTRTELDARRKTREFPYHGDVLVIDAITSTPGSPGGPLLDLDGHWMGMIGRMVISNQTHTNFNYAIPVEVVAAFIDSVLQPPSIDASDAATTAKVKPYHGIKLFEHGYRKKLVYVDRVKRGSPAKTAGLRKDDLIVSVGGRKVADIEAFERIIETKSPGDKLELAVIRNEELKNLTLVLGKAKQ